MMRLNRSIPVFLFFIAAGSAVFAGGTHEADSSLAQGAEMYRQGDLESASESFRKASASEERLTASAGHYNYGTIQAEMAEKAQDPASKKELLEKAYDSLKRAADIGGLPSGYDDDIRRNMEVVRDALSKLPKQTDNEPHTERDEKPGEEQQSDGEQQAGNGDEQNGSGSEGDIKERQRLLREKTESGAGDTDELAAEQKQLQKEAEEADKNEAAVNQAKAAEALKKGDRDKAAQYQKAAEQALSDKQQEEESGEAEDILNRETEYKAEKNRLDKAGGIRDVGKNW